jgi:hypothetical protein
MTNAKVRMKMKNRTIVMQEFFKCKNVPVSVFENNILFWQHFKLVVKMLAEDKIKKRNFNIIGTCRI